MINYIVLGGLSLVIPEVKEYYDNFNFVHQKKDGQCGMYCLYIIIKLLREEKKPLELACKKKQLCAFKHEGFWKCMDVKKDRDEVQKIYKNNKFNWKR